MELAAGHAFGRLLRNLKKQVDRPRRQEHLVSIPDEAVCPPMDPPPKFRWPGIFPCRAAVWPALCAQRSVRPVAAWEPRPRFLVEALPRLRDRIQLGTFFTTGIRRWLQRDRWWVSRPGGLSRLAWEAPWQRHQGHEISTMFDASPFESIIGITAQSTTSTPQQG